MNSSSPRSQRGEVRRNKSRIYLTKIDVNQIMKKIYFVVIILAILLIVGYVALIQNKTKNPEEIIKSLVNDKTIQISVQDNVVPNFWEGDSNCKYIQLTQSKATQSYWFCPKDWSGACKEINDDGTCNNPSENPLAYGDYQDYPAHKICEGSEYKLFYEAFLWSKDSYPFDEIKKELCE